MKRKAMFKKALKALIILLLILFYFLFDLNDREFTLLLCLWLLFVALFRVYDFIKIKNALLRKCDHTKSINKLKSELEDSEEKDVCLLALSSFYINYEGIFDEALEMLKQINVDNLNEDDKKNYYINLIYSYICLEDYDNVNKIIDFLDEEKDKAIIESVKKTIEYRNSTNEKIKDDMLQILSIKESKKCTRVIANYNLGCYYMKKNDKEQANEYFKYVIEHGNKFYHVNEAKRILNNEKKAEYDLSYIMYASLSKKK